MNPINRHLRLAARPARRAGEAARPAAAQAAVVQGLPAQSIQRSELDAAGGRPGGREAGHRRRRVNPAEVLTAVQKADIAFRMMMQIRNKMVQAYQEVQNIRM